MKVQSAIKTSLALVGLAALSLGSQTLRAEDNNSSGGGCSSCCGSVKKPYAKDAGKGTQSPSGGSGGATNAPAPSPAK